MHLQGPTTTRRHDKVRIRYLQDPMVPFEVPQPHQKGNPQEEMDLPLLQTIMITTSHPLSYKLLEKSI